MISRNDFLHTTLWGCAGLLFSPGTARGLISDNKPEQPTVKKSIHTVTGVIDSESMGLTLPHEHIMCDFIGADKVSKDRYDTDEIIKTMIPYVEEIRDLGVKTFVDCTPAYIGRDPAILAEISNETGINIITNTGFYKEPYLPRYTWELSADELAERWMKEITTGIEGTEIKADFIKIAVNPGPLIPIQQKIVTAACRTHKKTGVAIASHTVKGLAALEQLDIFEREEAEPCAFIYVHAQGERDQKYHYEVAHRGGWVEYDGINEKTAEQNLKLISDMAEKGYEDNLLLSQDSGWYYVGEEKGGNIRGFAFLVKEFIPLLEKNGFDKPLIDKLTITNPRRAFEI